MAETTELIVVLGIVYFLECVQVVPRRALALQATLLGRFALRPSLPIGLWRGAAIVVGWPLPPLGLTFVVDEWPVILDEDALVGEDGTRHGWDEVREAATHERRVLVGDAVIASLATESAAAALARALRHVARGEPKRRAALVEEVLAGRMDGRVAVARVAAFRRATWPLRLAASLLVTTLFAGLPLIFYTPLSERWPWFAGGAAAAWLATVITFELARRKLYRGDEGPAAGKMFTLILWPVAAMRAADLLGRHLLADLDPLAAAALLPDGEARAAVRRAVAELRFPAEPRDGWADERRRHALARLANERKLDLDAELAPPALDEPAVLRFCPRCRAQYVIDRERCLSCPDVRLLPVTAVSGSSAPPARATRRRGARARGKR